MSDFLTENIQKAKCIYFKRGFQTRIGYGKKVAIINVDLGNAWTKEGHAFSCDNMDKVISNVYELLEIARNKDVPIFFTTTAYSSSMMDGGLWVKKIPSLKNLKLGDEWTKIDSRLKPRPDEIIIVKKMASAFAGTGLQGMLTSINVDTVIITGVTASSCIRHTAMDALTLGFRPIIPEGTVSDRIPGAVEWNLFDIDAKFGDVEPLQNVKNYLKSINLFG